MRRHSQLTSTSLEARLKHVSPPGEIRDPATMGLQLRITAQARTWFYRYVYEGRRFRVKLGAYPAIGLADARASAQKARTHREMGIDPRTAGMSRGRAPSSPVAARSAKPHSVAALAEEFMRLSTRKRPEQLAGVINKHILPWWETRDARTITRRDVIELLDKVVATGRKVMANRVKQVLGQMFEFGMNRALVEHSPVPQRYRPGGEEKPRQRALTDAELKALIVNREDVFRSKAIQHAVMLLLLTMQRRGELMAAKWSDVDLDAATWRIPDEVAKGERGHTLALSEWALDEFRTLKRMAGRSAYVFPNAAGDGPADPKLVTRSVARCLKRLGKLKVAAFTPHDLRRTGRTGLAKLKVAPHIAERVLNHAQAVIPGTYDVHDYFDEKRDALDKWCAHLRHLTK